MLQQPDETGLGIDLQPEARTIGEGERIFRGTKCRVAISSLNARWQRPGEYTISEFAQLDPRRAIDDIYDRCSRCRVGLRSIAG